MVSFVYVFIFLLHCLRASSYLTHDRNCLALWMFSVFLIYAAHCASVMLLRCGLAVVVISLSTASDSLCFSSDLVRTHRMRLIIFMHVCWGQFSTVLPTHSVLYTAALAGPLAGLLEVELTEAHFFQSVNFHQQSFWLPHSSAVPSQQAAAK